VLHRDISTDSILLGQDGQNGVLIGLGRATRCKRGTAPAPNDDPNIVRSFASRPVDDLTVTPGHVHISITQQPIRCHAPPGSLPSPT